MRLTLIGLIGTTLALSIAACTAPRPVPGHLTGHLYGVGGPPAGQKLSFPGIVTISGLGVTREVRVGDDGGFFIELPPGDYTLVGRSPHLPSNGLQEPCPATTAAVVQPSATVALDAYCQLR